MAQQSSKKIISESEGTPLIEWVGRGYRLLGQAAHRSGDDGQVLHRRCNAKVIGEEHRRLWDGDRRDFGAHQRHAAGA